LSLDPGGAAGATPGLSAKDARATAARIRRTEARTAVRQTALLVVLLAAVFLQEFCSLSYLTASADEPAHLPSGYTYWKTGDFRLNPEHPPLVKLIAALPIVLFTDPVVNWNDPSWKGSPPDEVRFGVRFLYSNDADEMLFWGRLPVILLSVLLGWYVFRWASDLYGRRAGLVALFLYAFCPNILAHSRFVTMDLALSCFFLITLYYLWRFTRQGGARNLVLCGVALGLALGSKFSAVILLPLLPALVAMTALRRREKTAVPNARPRLTDFPNVAGRGARLLLAAGACAIVVAIGFFLVWAIYFFPGDPLFYLKGLVLVNANHHPEYWLYLAGNFRQGGWWYYFLAAFFFKTPAPTLLFLFLALALGKVSPKPTWANEGFLLVPAAVFFIITSAGAANVGIRYVLPVYPLLYVFSARLTDFVLARRLRTVVAAIFASWLAVGTVRVFPDYIPCFTDFVGGSSNGWKYLDDSNLDWGTDLKRLKTWMDDHGIGRINFYTPYSVLPGYYGIRYDWYEFMRREPPPPGLYAIATQILIRGMVAARIEGMATDWLHAYKPIDRVGYGFYIFKIE
jgi:hypothetical protein